MRCSFTRLNHFETPINTHLYRKKKKKDTFKSVFQSVCYKIWAHFTYSFLKCKKWIFSKILKTCNSCCQELDTVWYFETCGIYGYFNCRLTSIYVPYCYFSWTWEKRICQSTNCNIKIYISLFLSVKIFLQPWMSELATFSEYHCLSTECFLFNIASKLATVRTFSHYQY